MKFLVFCACFYWFLSQVRASEPSSYPISPNCDLITVENLAEVVEKHSETLAKAEVCVVFKLEASKTFLARKMTNRWATEASIETLANTKISSRFWAFSPMASKAKEESVWVEFYYDNFEHRTSDTLVPASPCHSELLGEGGLITLQNVFLTSISGEGKLGAEFTIRTFVISTSAAVSLSKANAFSVKLNCVIRHNEVGQLFLTNTKYLYYTPWSRILLYNSKTKEFSEGGKFVEKARERSIISGGVGDWICVTSSFAELQCSPKISSFLI
ncbi:hypothetical protein JCM33374_g4298 [Metschnikowia sp. JCM 33374]|nr:hypothetical protein JCM33374_g4298 [Metschnikowia sp. JCM 33374]